MHTTAAEHPTPDELLAFVDGEATQEVTGHVVSCERCTTESRGVASAQEGLRQSLYRFDCPAPHRLGEYELNLLEPDDRRLIASHAAQCDLCTTELHTLREFMATELTLPESLMSQVRRAVATLLTPARGPALAGVRGAQTAMRQYRVDTTTVSIGQGPEPGTLVGLVIRPDIDVLRGEVRLLGSSGEPSVTDLDELGNFEFEGVGAGNYALEIRLADEIIVIQELRVD